MPPYDTHPQLHLIDAVLSLQLLADAVDDAAPIEGLVCVDGHPDLVTHSQEQEATLRSVQGHFPDELVCGNTCACQIKFACSSMDLGLVVRLPKSCWYRCSRTGQMPVSRACLSASFLSSSSCSNIPTSDHQSVNARGKLKSKMGCAPGGA